MLLALFLLLFVNYLSTLQGNSQNSHEWQNGRGSVRRPIIFDGSRCPWGWETAGDGQCVQLGLSLRRAPEANSECNQLGGQLVNIVSNRQVDAALVHDLSHIINEAIQSGVKELTWLVGGVPATLAENGQLPHELWAKFTATGNQKRRSAHDYGYGKGIEAGIEFIEHGNDVKGSLKSEDSHLALRKRTSDEEAFDVVIVSAKSALPFICSLSDWKRQSLLYEQALLPKGAPKIIDQPPTTTTSSSLNTKPYYYHYYAPSKSSHHNEDTPANYVTLPCKAVGDPSPVIRWYHSGSNGEQINVNQPGSPYLISGGSLVINLSSTHFNHVTSFHCTATNKYGTVRSAPVTVRPVFMEPFRDTRLDVYPLANSPAISNNLQNGPPSNGVPDGGSRIECQPPRHYPKSHSYSWMYGGSTEQFVQVSERVFISMDGTLYFSYNLPQDDNKYACTLALSATQSGQHGPFFRLILPNYEKVHQPGAERGAPRKPKPFPPRIDEYQPAVFPEFPMRGQTVYIECFAYGYPSPTYKWSRVDGAPLSPRHRIINYGRVLRIDSARQEDAVRYKCTARNNLGTTSVEIQLIVQAPPSMLRPLEDQLVAANHSATFRCIVNTLSGGDVHTSGLSIEWFHDGKPLVPLLMRREDRQRFRLADNELRIIRTQPSDSGVYQCIVTSAHGDDETGGHSVSSSALLTVRDLPPRFHANVFPARVFVTEGAKLTIPCFYQASPKGHSQWRRVGASETVNNTNGLVKLADDVTEGWTMLRFAEIRHEDDGEYECWAYNGVGQGRAITRIFVLPLGKSSISSKNRNSLVCEVEIECGTQNGNQNYTKEMDCPEALFDWKFNDRPVRSLAYKKGRIRIRQAESKLRPSSELSTDAQSADPNPMSIKRLYTTQIDMPDSFTQNNVGRWSCTSAWSVGAVADLEPADGFILPPPTQLTAELRISQNGAWRGTQAAAKLTWRQAGLDTLRQNDAVHSYQIEWRTADNRNWQAFRLKVEHLNGSIYNSYLVSDLEPNRKYQFRLRSRAEDGSLSVPSVGSRWIETPQSPPREAVHNIRHKILDDHHLLLEWDPIETDHSSGSNLRYNVSWTPTDKNVVLKGRQDIVESFETVEEPTLVLALAAIPTSKKFMKRNNGNNIADIVDLVDKNGEENEACQSIAVGVRPFNDLGSGPMGTDTVIQLTREGPKRQAINLQLSPLNSTHLNLTWEWLHEGQCENVMGAQISCDEFTANSGYVNETKPSLDSDGEMSAILGEMNEDPRFVRFQAINQSVPAYYTAWIVHSLWPLTEYRCQVRAFDQHGRWGPPSVGTSNKAKTREPAPSTPPDVTHVRLDKDDPRMANLTTFSILVDWRPVPLGIVIGESRDAKNRSLEAMTQRGYKVFVYVETSDRPTILTLYEYQLQQADNPSARIDGLKRRFHYTIQIGAFNKGGLGPLSEPIFVHISSTVNDSLFAARDGGIALRACLTSLSMITSVLLFMLLNIL
ncbi:immunoglobulin domain-containing protein [Ditylenchus destructor]|nr:immunoglobulin domain-containing protein [Ditylenchus destructor]